MTTVHEEAAMVGFREFMSTEDGAKALQVYFAGLKEGRWEADYVQAIGQHAWLEPSQWPMEQVYAFMMVHHMIMDGEIGKVQIGPVSGPSADRDREVNQLAISDLPGPFVATVYRDQKTSEYGDGRLEWAEHIQVEQSTGVPYIDPCGNFAPLIAVKTLPPGGVPLEIGTTHASKTLDHLTRFGGVARWAYGSDRILLFKRTRPARSIL
jgi:hypothetical protein